ncbi:MAG TPA: TonB-dependent receptor [Ignavibacteriaceae bacterium]|nr:TonB-dependent receptor [Ignavibacteriaceae bacterium]
MFYIKKIMTAMLLMCISITSQQKDSLKTLQLDEVVISANRINTLLSKVGSAITIIDSTEIEHSKKQTVLDILKNEYGLYFTQQGGPGKLANIYLRGDNPGHTLVLLDGVEINMANDPVNTFDFANLPLDNVERIEVLRGPQSTLYGSEALSGVINILTKEGLGKPKFFLTAEGGSYNTYKGSIGSSGAFGKLNYFANLIRYKTDGFSSAGVKYGATEKDGAENYSASGKIGYEALENLNFNLSYNFQKADADLDQFGGMFGDDPSYTGKSEEQLVRFETKYSGLKAGINFSRNIRKYYFDVFPNSFSKSWYDGKKYKADLQYDLSLNDNHIMTLGAEHEIEQAISDYLYADYVSAFPQKQNNTSGIYLQDKLDFNFGLTLSTGVRFDYNQKFKDVFTFRFAPSYFNEPSGIKIRGSIGNAFKTPSLFNLFDPLYGNAELKPEKSLGWDAGVEKYFYKENISAGINYFNNKFKDLYGLDQNFKMMNTGEAYIQGVELFSLIKLSNDLNVKVNYTFLDSKDETNYSDSANMNLKMNKPLLRRPKHKAGLFVDYTFFNQLNANVEVIYVGKRDDIFFSTQNERTTLADYTLLNVSASYKYEFAEIYVKGENLLNKDYEEIYGFGTAKRSGYAGLKINL